MVSGSRQRLTAAVAAVMAVGAVSSLAQQPPQGQSFGGGRGFGGGQGFGGQRQGQPRQPGGRGFGGGGQGQPGQPGQPGQNPFGPQPGGFGGQFGLMPLGMPMMPVMPELAKKTNQIMALRHIVGMGLTAKDIQAALPPLKELRDAEKTLQTRSEQILEEEKRALLAAEPGNQPDPDTGEKMRQANERYREVNERSWQRIMQAIGPEKAGGLRQLVEGGFGGPGFPRGGGFGGNFAPVAPGGGGFGGPAAGFPGNAPAFPPQPRPGGDELPGEPLAPVPGLPGSPTPEVVQEPLALPTGSPAPAILPQVPGEAPVIAQAPPQGQPGQPGQGGRRPGFQPRGQGGAFGGGQNGFAPGGPGPQGPPPMAFGPRISLAELVDLLEQKLAAMRH